MNIEEKIESARKNLREEELRSGDDVLVELSARKSSGNHGGHIIEGEVETPLRIRLEDNTVVTVR